MKKQKEAKKQKTQDSKYKRITLEDRVKIELRYCTDN